MPSRVLSKITCLALLVAGDLARGEGGTPAGSTFKFEDYLIAPIRVHLLVARGQPALCTSLSNADIERIVGKINRVWAQAGVSFAIESIIREEPALTQPTVSVPEDSLRALLTFIPPASYRDDLFNVYFVKQFGVNGVYFPKAIFVKDTASLRPVEGGIDEPLPRVTAHELGHALGLRHRQDTFNLMASGTTGTSLNSAEIDSTRQRAEGIAWFVHAPELLLKADALLQQGKTAEAQALYTWLGALPLEGEPLSRIRRLSGK